MFRPFIMQVYPNEEHFYSSPIIISIINRYIKTGRGVYAEKVICICG